MPIVNFSIPATLDRRVKEVAQIKGFSSRAELFRFALMNYLETVQVKDQEVFPLDNNPEIVALCDQIEDAFRKKIGSRPLPSVKQQLARIKNL